MTEIGKVLDHMINKELSCASNFVTRSTIKLRVLMKVSTILGLPMSTIYETKSLLKIDLSCSQAIERAWNEKVKNMQQMSMSNQPTSDEWATIERFLARDFARNIDLVRLTAVLQKRVSMEKLYFIFAVDGLYDDDNSKKIMDFRPYFDNLSLPITLNHEKDTTVDDDDESLAEIHSKAIRIIYHHLYDCTPEKLGKVLRRMFNISCDSKIMKTPMEDTTITTHHTIINMHNEKISDRIQNDNDDEIEDGSNTDNSSDSSSDEDDENRSSDRSNRYGDIIENNIENWYKKIVGKKLIEIATWKKSEIERINEAKRLNNTNKAHHTTKRKYNKKILLVEPQLTPPAVPNNTTTATTTTTTTTTSSSTTSNLSKSVNENSQNNFKRKNVEDTKKNDVFTLSSTDEYHAKRKKMPVTDDNEEVIRAVMSIQQSSEKRKKNIDDSELLKKKKIRNM